MRILGEKSCKIAEASGAPPPNPRWFPAAGAPPPDHRFVTLTYCCSFEKIFGGTKFKNCWK